MSEKRYFSENLLQHYEAKRFPVQLSMQTPFHLNFRMPILMIWWEEGIDRISKDICFSAESGDNVIIYSVKQQ